MAFSRFHLDELAPGLLATLFQAGEVAAIIECGDMISRLWSLLLLNPAEKMPWDLPLSCLARNHWAGNDLTTTVGDVFYFQPAQHSYIARKLEISRCNGSAPQVRPDCFHQPDGTIAPSPELVELSCRISDRIMDALTPAADPRPQYKVAVQRLKYQAEWSDFEKLCSLVSNSLGRWGRSGYALDVSRQRPAPLLSGKGISDLLGLLMMTPAVGQLLQRWNQKLLKSDPVAGVAPGEQVYERAHEDYRFYSALCGSRENVRTEVLYQDKWVPLPVNLTSLVVFPGTLFRAAGIKGTTHRVVYQPTQGEAAPGQISNVTVLLGGV